LVITTAEEFNNVIIRTDGAKTVRLSDIGRAELGPENIETKQSVWFTFGLAIVPRPGLII
jgi:HAE1 family hydrophobic/amphiphilic exporter-1/multidrug efflux pump